MPEARHQVPGRIGRHRTGRKTPLLPLSRPSEHAIRALTYLANRPGQEPVLTRVLAEELEIPAPFLAKVLHPLIQRGFLSSQRGRGGGIRLVGRPEEIRLLDVVETLEHLGGPRPCFLGQAECSDDRACPMHDLWKRSWATHFQALERTTLASLVTFCQSDPASGYPARAS